MDYAVETKKQGTLTVLEKSRELFALLCKVVADDNLIPRYFKHSIGDPLTDHAREIAEQLAVANSIDLFDKEVQKERKMCQLSALRSIVRLLSALRVMYSVCQFGSEKMQILLTKTIEVQRLLKKWVDSDANRLGAALNIIKKDPIETNLFDKGITAKDLFNDAPKADFDALFQNAAANPIPTKHHETKQVVYVRAPDPVQPPPKVEEPELTREERIAKLLAGRQKFNIHSDGGDAPILGGKRSTSSKPVTQEEIAPTVEVAIGKTAADLGKPPSPIAPAEHEEAPPDTSPKEKVK